MRRLSIVCIVLLGSLCVFQSCKKDKGETFQMSDQEFVLNASSGNALEIAAGDMATEKGQSKAVKDFGDLMVSDHSEVQADLSALAATKGLGMSQTLLTHHETNLNILSQVSTQLFDLRFAELMVLSHQEAVNLFLVASQPNGVPDPELRSWAASKVEALQSHLQAAQSLYVQVNQ